MIALADSSVLVASLVPDDPHHEACDAVLNAGGLRIYVHSIAETFSTLTGGRQSIRTGPATAAELIAKGILPFAQIVTLSPPIFCTASTRHRRAASGAEPFTTISTSSPPGKRRLNVSTRSMSATFSHFIAAAIRILRIHEDDFLAKLILVVFTVN